MLCISQSSLVKQFKDLLSLLLFAVAKPLSTVEVPGGTQAGNKAQA
jgi:hypothetical protein